MTSFNPNGVPDEYADFGDCNSDDASQTIHHHASATAYTPIQANQAPSAVANSQATTDLIYDDPNFDWNAFESFLDTAVLGTDGFPTSTSGSFLGHSSFGIASSTARAYNGSSNDRPRTTVPYVGPRNGGMSLFSQQDAAHQVFRRTNLGLNPLPASPNNISDQGRYNAGSDNSRYFGENHLEWIANRPIGGSGPTNTNENEISNAAPLTQPGTKGLSMFGVTWIHPTGIGANHVFPARPIVPAVIPSQECHRSLPFSFSLGTASSAPPPATNPETRPSSLGLAHLCSKCNRYFHAIEELNRHNEDHARPHVCLQKCCTDRFATSTELKQHKMSRHRSSLLWCPRAGCDRVEGGSGNPFGRTDNLNKHIKDVHDNKRLKRERDHERSLRDSNLNTETLSPSPYEEEGGKTPKVDESANKRRRVG